MQKQNKYLVWYDCDPHWLVWGTSKHNIKNEWQKHIIFVETKENYFYLYNNAQKIRSLRIVVTCCIKQRSQGWHVVITQYTLCSFLVISVIYNDNARFLFLLVYRPPPRNRSAT